jgi:hypothetical protein
MAEQSIEMSQKTQPGSRVADYGRPIPPLGESFEGVRCWEIGQTFDLQIAQMHRKVTESLVEVVSHHIQRTVSVKMLLVNLAEADPIGAQSFDTLLAVAVGAELE